MSEDESASGASELAVTEAAISERLDRVYDPELDRSVVELQYVEDVTIDDGHVTVLFVLPTAWCSPAFAWMMATGIREEVGTLAGVEEVSVQLLDHMHEAEINRGVNEDLPFEEVFDDAEDGIEDVRRVLDEKARLARQYHAITALLDAGLDPEQIVGVTPAELHPMDDHVAIYLHDESVGVLAPAEPITRYLERARSVGVASDPEAPMFASADGTPIEPSAFDTVRRHSRLAWSNVSGQAGICASLHEARNGVQLKEV